MVFSTSVCSSMIENQVAISKFGEVIVNIYIVKIGSESFQGGVLEVLNVVNCLFAAKIQLPRKP